MVRDPVGNVLRGWASKRPDRICCAVDDRSYTFAEMDARSDEIAAGIAALGLGKGDRVATLASGRAELLELYYGLAKAGTPQVPLNDAEGDEVPYAELSAAGSTPPDVALTAADTMSIVYTSGTTGLPKGCVASHGYYCRCGDIVGTALEITDDDVLFSGLPLFHAGARLVCVAMPLMFGIPAHIQGTFSATSYLPRAKEVGATVMIAVGPMGTAVLATDPSPADRDHRVNGSCARRSPRKPSRSSATASGLIRGSTYSARASASRSRPPRCPPTAATPPAAASPRPISTSSCSTTRASPLRARGSARSAYARKSPTR
jgi:carnitine-CoA ligase